MKILAVSDQRLTEMEKPDYLRQNYGEAQILISCGDIDPSYLEFIATILNLPLYFVKGNHDNHYEEDSPGGDNLHLQFSQFEGIRMVGLEGSRYYNGKNIQHTEAQMSLYALQLLPRMYVAQQTHGYGVDYLVTHSPPAGIHDRDDVAHQGFKSFLWLMRLGRPRYLIHGHIDIWDRRETTETQYYGTRIININPKRLLDPEQDDRK
jgi:uncharacterized protein